MKCQNCRTCDGPQNEATCRVWCPTWITAHEGPRHLCERCARTFKPEHNPNSKDGMFFWNEAADTAFNNVESIMNRDRAPARYHSAEGMVKNGAAVGPSTYVVDGKVWLLNYHNILRLGSWPEVKETFPNLFYPSVR